MLDRILPGPSPRALDHRGRGLVASGLDSEYKHGVLVPCWSASERSVAQSSGIHPAARHARQPAGAGAGPHGARRRWPRRMARAGADRDRGDPHQRRPHPGPAAGGGRRQGAVHQGDRGGAAAGAIDLAVHSSKDMPTVLPPGLVLSAFLPREDPRDVFISRKAKSIAELPHGATVGTASLRRQALVSACGPISTIVPLRGNVETRLRKLDEGVADATLLALAGLKRLGLADAATAVLDVDEFLPAVGQGAIGIETRADDTAHARTAGGDQSCRHVQRARRRTRLSRRARRLVPHADRRPCDDRRRTDSVSRHDRAARRQRGIRSRARRRCARCRTARRRCRPRIEGPRRPRFLQACDDAAAGHPPRARQRAHRGRVARAGPRGHAGAAAAHRSRGRRRSRRAAAGPRS